MADKIQTDNIDVALAQIAFDLTPHADWFTDRDKGGQIADFKRQAEYFAVTFHGLMAVKNKSHNTLTAEQIADAFKWQG